MNVSAHEVAQPAELVVLIADAKATSYATVASLALLLFDYALTFAQEVDLVWKRRLTWGKVLFTGSSTGVLWGVEFTLALRVWLLYNRSFVVLLSLGFVYTSSIATNCHLCESIVQPPNPATPQVLSSTFSPWPEAHPSAVLTCLDATEKFPRISRLRLTDVFIQTSTLMILTVYKTMKTMRHAGTGSQKPPMVALLLRDGILYFVAIFGVLVANFLVFYLARATLTSLATGFFVAVPCMTGSRLFLNVREKLLHPDATTEASLSTFRMRPYPYARPSVEVEIPELGAGRESKMEPDSATTLVGRAPWEEEVDEDVGEDGGEEAGEDGGEDGEEDVGHTSEA
ncbi:hypothetical protein JB92DRAFT_3125490 [Gautieria morchelliformis]|nr:hypothetical protein JB92DRAFT_3125490 [Gautieria morchelliformis]